MVDVAYYPPSIGDCPECILPSFLFGYFFGKQTSDRWRNYCLFTFWDCLCLFFYELRTTLTEEGIRVHFYPYTSQNVSWGEVEHCEVIPYDFVGGWGVRLWTQYGTVYNVQGGKGLYVQLKNKKKFLVGTQKPEELQLLVQQLQHSALDVVAE
jgi:hypothetical protein